MSRIWQRQYNYNYASRTGDSQVLFPRYTYNYYYICKLCITDEVLHNPVRIPGLLTVVVGCRAPRRIGAKRAHQSQSSLGSSSGTHGLASVFCVYPLTTGTLLPSRSVSLDLQDVHYMSTHIWKDAPLRTLPSILLRPRIRNNRTALGEALKSPCLPIC